MLWQALIFWQYLNHLLITEIGDNYRLLSDDNNVVIIETYDNSRLYSFKIQIYDVGI